MSALDDLLNTAAQKPRERSEQPVSAAQDHTAGPDKKVQTEPPTADAGATADEQERRLTAEADHYEALLPAIAAAQPLPATWTPDAPLSGTGWLVDGARRALPVPAGSPFTVNVGVNGHAITVTITCAPGTDRGEVATAALAELHGRGNLGTFTPKFSSDGVTIYLDRENVAGAQVVWRSAGTNPRLFLDEAGQRKAFDAAGLYQTNKRTKERRYPSVIAWGEDHRGATCTLRLQPGQTLAQVQAATGRLAQALRCPDLAVDAASGSVDPVIHLNSRPISRELPRVNPLRPEQLVRPRNQAERYAAAGDFVLPVGVHVDDETGEVRPILVNQAQVPHMAVFGGTGSGKTVLLSQMVEAAVIQGAEVVLFDAKMGKDIRNLALDKSIPGIVHYAAGHAAVLHRTILWVRHEFERRQVLAEKLAYRGIDYCPTPLLLVLDEFPWWIDGLKARKGEHQKAAEQTEAHLSAIAAEARELRIYYVVAGQYAYSSGYSGAIRTNTQTLISLGPPKKINMANLFVTSDERKLATELSATIRKVDKGVGVMLDDTTNEVVKFRGFFNPTGPDADRFAAAVAQAPKLRRFAYALPRGGVEGGDGSWSTWTPVSDPPSDSLHTRYLDGPDGRPLADAEIDDPTSPNYRPGRRPMPAVHLHEASYDLD